MLTKTFFKLFPPPKFLNIPYAGLDISDDAIHCIMYSESIHGYKIDRFGMRALPSGIIESGFIKNEAELIKIISSLVDELKIVNVKASLPEEKMYLFKTDVPTKNKSQIRQNIESKLEENVPLSPVDAIFFFDIFPEKVCNGKNIVSVSVAPKTLVDSYLKVLESAGLEVISFESQPKALAHVVVNHCSSDVQILVNLMEKKAGIYIVCGDIVCFTSTITFENYLDIVFLSQEINKVYSYWNEHGEGRSIIKIILSGKKVNTIDQIQSLSPDPKIPVEVAQVWQNVHSHEHYIPPIHQEESLEYAVSAGLALP